MGEAYVASRSGACSLSLAPIATPLVGALPYGEHLFYFYLFTLTNTVLYNFNYITTIYNL